METLQNKVTFLCNSEDSICANRSCTNSIIIGPDSDILGNSDSCIIVGQKNLIPQNAKNCHIFGSNIHLTNENVLRDITYIGGTEKIYLDKQTFLYGPLKKISDTLNELFTFNMENHEAMENICLVTNNREGETEFIDIIPKIQELEDKLNMLLYAPGGPMYLLAKDRFENLNSSPLS